MLSFASVIHFEYFGFQDVGFATESLRVWTGVLRAHDLLYVLLHGCQLVELFNSSSIDKSGILILVYATDQLKSIDIAVSEVDSVSPRDNTLVEGVDDHLEVIEHQLQLVGRRQDHLAEPLEYDDRHNHVVHRDHKRYTGHDYWPLGCAVAQPFPEVLGVTLESLVEWHELKG